jgi:hypothetical protein
LFLNTFLKDQIKDAESKSNPRQGKHNANAIIEEAAQMRARGVQQEELIDYVKNATSHYGAVFKSRGSGLSKMKITEKDKAEDAEAEARHLAIKHSDESDLIFLNNRTTHTNKLNGYNRSDHSNEKTKS